MKLTFDLDGVLANFNDAYHGRLLKVTGENRFPTDWQPLSWDWDRDYGYTAQEIADTWANIWKDKLFWRKLKPLAEPEVFARIAVLSKTHDVYFLTHRSGIDAKQQTERWLYDQGINYPTVIMTGDKLPILKAIKADFFIDDKLDTMNEIVAAINEPKAKWQPSHLYMMDAPYNRKNRDDRLHIATSVKHALEQANLW